MADRAAENGSIVRQWWDRLSGRPGGRWLFSKIIGRIARYSGTMGARVLELGPGHSRLELRDRPKVRNHLKSVHAVALMNLAELSSGLAFMYTVPPTSRGILTRLSIDYLKKGRGRLVASCSFEPPDASVKAEHDVVSEIRDEAGDVVARATARWLVSPIPETPGSHAGSAGNGAGNPAAPPAPAPGDVASSGSPSGTANAAAPAAAQAGAGRER